MNKVFSRGNNQYGQLGLGHSKDIKGWKEVTMPKDFQLVKIEIGCWYSFCGDTIAIRM